MKKVRKTKHQAWFVHIRNSYLPSSWQGLVIYLIYVGYIISIPVVWYKNGHYLWQLLTTVIPLIIAGVLLTQYVASKNSKSK
jgi:hypothetical protein